MKKFALYLTPEEKPKIFEGTSATVKRDLDGLTVTIFNGKKKTVIKGVVIFCEVSEKIKVV